MANNKLQRTNEDIMLALSEILRSIKDPRVNQGLISVTAVDTTGDLRWCKVYVSVFGLQNEKEFMKGIKSASGWIRRELGSRVKLRIVPELVFQLDHSIEHGAHMNQIFSELKAAEEQHEQNDQ